MCQTKQKNHTNTSLLYRLHRPLERAKATRTRQHRDALAAELDPHLAEDHLAPANPVVLHHFTPTRHPAPINYGGFLDATVLCDYHYTQPRSTVVQQVTVGSSGAKPSSYCWHGFLSYDIPKTQKASGSSNSPKSKLGSESSLLANGYVSLSLSQHFFHKKRCYGELKT